MVGAEASFRLAAYAVCVEDGRMLLAHHVPTIGEPVWTLPGGSLRPEPSDDVAESVWTPIPDVAGLRRSSLVDVGLALAQSRPATGHVAPVPVGGLVRH